MPTTITKPKANKAEPKKNAAAKFVEAALAKAERKNLMLKEITFTDQNARITSRTQEEIEEMAISIEATGLLQNLVVHRMADGRYGAAAGETRRLGMDLLMVQGRSAAGVPVTPEFIVPVLVVDEQDAYAISVAENVRRTNLQPADQLENIRLLATKGTPPEQIGAILGFSTLHVKKCLKLTTVAPALLELLKTNQINFDQLAALGATDDHLRQIQAWDKGKYDDHFRTPKALRKIVLADEVSAADSQLVNFVGIDAYQAAGGEIREEMFVDDVILTDPLKLETLAIAKLQAVADDVAKNEGWAWSVGRTREAKRYTDDEKTFEIPWVTTRLTSEQKAEMDQLLAEQELLDDMLDATGLDADDEWEHAPRVEQIEARINEINAAAELNQWPPEVRAKAGIIAYLKDGQIQIQRGLMKVEDIKQQEKANREEIKKNTPPSEKGLSQVLVASLSAERTLAVSAALAQNTNVAIALHTFTLARRVFDKGYFYVLHTSVESMRSGCLSQSEEAGSASGIANQKLNEMHESWLNQFPENWSDSFEWLLAWPQGDVLGLLAYCISHGLDGRDSYLKDKRVGTKLDSVEKALDFQIGEWWKPTSDNYFSRIGKDQIVDALNSAGESVKAKDAEGMKRKEAAEFAAAVLSETGWLPSCMAPQPQAETENRADATASFANANDTDADDSAAA
ncbi:TPA: ParB/RepB/Spo0J family partition protein [Serratia marcescens]|nr:ParB/RepB/Spo0J family partition protein [Serratia marcescens]HEJ9022601.1 ParB/RepB/Spo0J family partition protein [Serratia marcescens]HEJ9028331.1 ParB/RepB/Spo0J family partition protein [Serratia marcescens]HEJ9044057.1 ParB/RepB/Spo0J family partition protein [Serratia marcescens]HEJ9087075.1 ParB/RepB/Spo0J family partition protein [Serratia marcescens]